jgi:hypothetical protein
MSMDFKNVLEERSVVGRSVASSQDFNEDVPIFLILNEDHWQPFFPSQ